MKLSLATTAVAVALLMTGCVGADEAGTEADTAPADSAESETAEPAATESDTTGTEQAEATAEDVKKKLDVVFEGCDWQEHGEEGKTPLMFACEENDILFMTGGKSEVKVTTQSIADDMDTPTYASITDTYSVYSYDQGAVNMAWDALGADSDGTPHEVK